MSRMTKDDVADFRQYCKQCTDAQVTYIVANANNRTERRLAREEGIARGILS